MQISLNSTLMTRHICIQSNTSEWMVNQHRDSIASYIGHPQLLQQMAIVQGESIGRVRHQLMQKMMQPCGPPPGQQHKND